jgi:hypothetical protein
MVVVVVLEIKLMALNMLGTYSTMELHPQSNIHILNK